MSVQMFACLLHFSASEDSAAGTLHYNAPNMDATQVVDFNRRIAEMTAQPWFLKLFVFSAEYNRGLTVQKKLCNCR